MKKNIPIFVLLFLLNHALLAQSIREEKVPVCVKDSLQKHYSRHEKVKWAIDTSHSYVAKFKYLGFDHLVRYGIAGQWLETTASVPPRVLPDKIQHWVKEFYPGYEAKRVKRTEIPGQAAYYTFDLESANDVYVMKMSENGKLIEKYRDRF